jgi:hypothetical protein
LECASTPWHPDVGSMRFRCTIAVRLAVMGAINVIVKDELMYAYEGVTLGRSPRGQQSVNVIRIGMKLPGTPTPPSELTVLVITRVLMLVGHHYRRKWKIPVIWSRPFRMFKTLLELEGKKSKSQYTVYSSIKIERALNLVTPYSGFVTSSEPSSVKYPGRRGTHKWSGTGALYPVLNHQSADITVASGVRRQY